MGTTDLRSELLVLHALGDRARTTSQLYDDVGYPALMQAGLIPYKAFRAVLERLEKEALVSGHPDEDGATVWESTERGRELASRYSAA